MLKAIMIAAFGLMTAAPALAQSSETAKPAAAPLTSALSIETLLADPRSKAVVDANVPNLAQHPLYDSFKGLTLAQLQPLSEGKITAATLAAIDAGLAAIK
jgi:hypothetical protein